VKVEKAKCLCTGGEIVMAGIISGIHEVLYTGITTDLPTLVAACAFPPDAFFLAERLPQQVIVDQQERQELLCFARMSDLGKTFNPALYTSGRIFSHEFELRWDQNQEPGKIHLVYSGSEETWPDLICGHAICAKQLSFTKRTQRAYYMFGEALASDRLARMELEECEASWYYAEVRIPRLLRYPRLADHLRKRRVQLAVYEYPDEKTGAVNWFRFQDLQVAE
jgi:hypothetical protein